MTLEELRAVIGAMKTSAADKLRTYGRVLGSEAPFVEALCAALGEISLDEALDALTSESIKLRQSIIDENRKADNDEATR